MLNNHGARQLAITLLNDEYGVSEKASYLIETLLDTDDDKNDDIIKGMERQEDGRFHMSREFNEQA